MLTKVVCSGLRHIHVFYSLLSINPDYMQFQCLDTVAVPNIQNDGGTQNYSLSHNTIWGGS